MKPRSLNQCAAWVGQHEEAIRTGRSGLAFGEFEQSFSALAAPICIVDGQAREFGETILGVGVHRGACDDRTVAFDDVEVSDLRFELLSRAAHQRA